MAKIAVSSSDKEDLSPDDIQAQIDANINAAVKKPTNSTATEVKVKTDAPSQPKEVATKPAEPAVVSHKGKVLNPADAHKDEEASEVVQVKQVAKAETNQPKEETQTEEVADESAKTPLASKPKTIEPPNSTVPAPSSQPEVEAKIENNKYQGQEVADKIGEISDDIKDREAQKHAEENKAQQQPQIFDTKQYHLPIKATKHHKKSSLGLTGSLFILLILVILAAYLAADAELYDPGFNLPYNFI